VNSKKLLEEIEPAPGSDAADSEVRLCRSCGAVSVLGLLPVRVATISPGVAQKSVHCPQCGVLLARTVDGKPVAVALGRKSGTPSDEIPASAKGEDPRMRPGMESDPDALRARQMEDLTAELAEVKRKLAAVLPAPKTDKAPPDKAPPDKAPPDKAPPG
jgi:hypothetical protein